jgi:hypothetical protein
MRGMVRLYDGKVRLEQTMAVCTKPKHRSTKHDRIEKRCSLDVLDYVGKRSGWEGVKWGAGGREGGAGLVNQDQ